MKKFAAVAAVSLGALAFGAAGTSSAAEKVTFHQSGNFQYSSPVAYCNNGVPAVTFAYRTLNLTEKQVTFSAPGYKSLVVTNVKPYTSFDGVTTRPNVVGKTLVVTGKGSTSGTSFTQTLRVPATCANLPTSAAAINWSNAPKATAKPAQPTKPAETAKPSKPAQPTKPAQPAKPAETAKPAQPAKPAAPAPAEGQGPRVETDYVAQNGGFNNAAALALGGAVVAGAGVTVAARRRK